MVRLDAEKALMTHKGWLADQHVPRKRFLTLETNPH
jgi:hypothetical protein